MYSSRAENKQKHKMRTDMKKYVKMSKKRPSSRMGEKSLNISPRAKDEKM